MLAAVRSGTFLGCIFLLMSSVFVYSKLAPPCMSQLGLRHNASLNPLTFHLEVFDGEADHVRLNSPQAWIPLNTNESFLQINISQPVLLTALQVQGDPQLTGRVTGWLLETSLDCDNYHSENYSIEDSERLHGTETVLLHKIEFVTCIRLKPTHYRGQTPALRLELLGCAVYDNSRCCPGVQQATELWLDGGGCQLNYEREVVLSWVKVLLQLQAASGDNVTVSFSLSCQQWHYLDTSNMSVVSVTSADQRSRWVTLELQTPVRARCLRIFPPVAAKLSEVHTSDCGSRLPSSLVELEAGSRGPTGQIVEEITSVARTNINSRETTAASPTTTLEALKAQTPGEHSSTKPNETLVTTAQCILTNSDIDNNESQANITQYNNDIKNSKNNNGSQADLTQYNNDTTNSKNNNGSQADLTQYNNDTSNSKNNNGSQDNLTQYNNDTTNSKNNNESQADLTQYNNYTANSKNNKGSQDNLTQYNNDTTNSKNNNGSQADLTQYNNDTSNTKNNNGSQDNLTQYNNDTTNSKNNNGSQADLTQYNNDTKNSKNNNESQDNLTQYNNDTKNSKNNNESQDNLTQYNNDTRNSKNNNESQDNQTQYNNDTKNSKNNNGSQDNLTQYNNDTRNSKNNNESQEDNLTQYNNNTQNSKNNTGSQDNLTPYNNDTTISNKYNSSTNSLLLDTLVPAENMSTTVASTEKTTTTETLRDTNISNESILTDTSSGNKSTHQTSSNDSTSFNMTAIEQHENADRNRTITESTSTQSGLSDMFTHITITPTVQGGSSDKPPVESQPDTSKSKGNGETQCGVKTEASGVRRKRVIGGHKNSPGEWPWLVSLHYLIEFDFTKASGFKHTCGATLVAPGWVITAAHCFADELLNGLSNLTCWRVYLGMHDLAEASSDHFVQERLIDAVYKFPKYNILGEPLLYDLALVKLNESVEITERASPICLDDHTDLHDEDSLCYVSGWGQTTMSTPGSRFPHTAAMTTMTLSRCKEMYDKLGHEHDIKQYARIEPPVLCAAVGSDGQDACQGDSGGPLMCERHGRWFQAGIVAGGYLCGHQATPGLYTRISYYSKWITETMGLHND